MLKQVVQNMGLLLGGKAVAGLISLIYLVIVTRTLGPHDYGVLVLVNGYVVAVGGVIAFSGWHTVVRYGAQALADGDHARLTRLVRFMALVEIACALLAMGVAVAGVPYAAARFGWSPEIIPIARWYALAVLSNVVTTPYGVLQLAGRFDRLGVQATLSPIIRLVGTLIVWLSGGGLTGFLIVWLAGSVCEGLSVWVLAAPIFRTMLGRTKVPAGIDGVKNENAGIIRFLVTTNADLTLRDLAPKLVPLVIGATLGAAAAGIYSLAQRAAVVLQQPATQLAQASFPIIARLIAAGDRVEAKRLTWRTSGLALAAAAPFVVVFAFFAKQILELLGGKGFESGAFLLVLLAIGRGAQLGSVPFSSALIALGRTGQSIMVNIIANIGLLPLLVLLLYRYNINGAGWHGLVLGLTMLIVLALVFRAGKDDPHSVVPATLSETDPKTDMVAISATRQGTLDG
ncbi:lipopolysaccharide biosynthesis protein [Sphingomonas paeninsulae]|jgi:O-antigen/teichoic acid export membrane protein|uniref:Lipopolysaccharide biosynthesis protein n=1 Tax=Sphingomonas paeninsulae TaxID=2319844 RepID=A0A494TJ68_SPHPE|nr:lipopolysaccharide biosynthesis protein [Sphingomonas paeninsulae]AYJ87392.1 lipopolysaccharide biosynthesis protein [Sphingomonas paeninsulae]